MGFSEDIRVRGHSQTTHTPDKLRMTDIGAPVRPLRDSETVKRVDLIDSDCIFVLSICSFRSSEFVLQDVRHCLGGFQLKCHEHF